MRTRERKWDDSWEFRWTIKMIKLGEVVGEDLHNLIPLACYRCRVRGHLARDCPSSGTQSQPLGSSSSGPTRGTSFKSVHTGPK